MQISSTTALTIYIPIIAFVRVPDIQRYGIDAILESITEVVNELEKVSTDNIWCTVLSNFSANTVQLMLH